MQFDAVVIGAGVAGLSAARRLREAGARLCVVEAQNAVGGRVAQVHGVAPWPLELGPEFVHGARSPLVDVCRGIGMQFKEVAWPDHVYWGADKALVPCGASNPEFEALDSLMFDEVCPRSGGCVVPGRRTASAACEPACTCSLAHQEHACAGRRAPGGLLPCRTRLSHCAASGR